MKIETLQIKELRPDPANARQHDEKNLKAIQGSLNQFGQRKPIVITEAGVIVAGNGTVEAAKRLGWLEIQAVRVPGDWTPEQTKAFALADNRTAELASWNEEILNKQLDELEQAGFGIAEWGFENPEVPILNVETFEDEIPEMPQKPNTNLGDVWQLGNHRLVCGDSTDSKILSKALDGELADCVFTDPPYNVAYQGGTKDKMTIQNDDMGELEFEKFIMGFYTATIENTKEGGAIYVCHPSKNGNVFRNLFVDSGWLLKQVLVWVKDSLVLSRSDYNWQHEPILYGWKPGAAHSWYGPFTNTTVIELEKRDWAKLSKDELIEFIISGFESSTVIREKRPRRSDLHPTMKPIALVAKMLKNSCVKNDRVLDPFGGSGSTLIACEQLGLKASLVELDPKYCDVIITRWESLTGQTAQLLSKPL